MSPGFALLQLGSNTRVIQYTRATIDSTWKTFERFWIQVVDVWICQSINCMSIFYYTFLYLGLCTSTCTPAWVHVCTCVLGHTWGAQRITYGGQYSPFYHVSPGSQTQVCRIGSKHLFTLSHITGPHIISCKLNYFLINAKIRSSIECLELCRCSKVWITIITFAWWVLLYVGLLQKDKSLMGFIYLDIFTILLNQN